jgi:hypothetical protein
LTVNSAVNAAVSRAGLILGSHHSVLRAVLIGAAGTGADAGFVAAGMGTVLVTTGTVVGFIASRRVPGGGFLVGLRMIISKEAVTDPENVFLAFPFVECGLVGDGFGGEIWGNGLDLVKNHKE